MADNKYIDVESALARIGGNEGLYKRLLGKFESSIDIPGFKANMETSDYLKAGEIVHAAKGIAGNLSLTSFFEQSSKLMEQLRDSVPQEADVQLFLELFDETKAAVAAYLG